LESNFEIGVALESSQAAALDSLVAVLEAKGVLEDRSDML
jgi:hypothetical protein